MSRTVLLIDFGSTYTKATAVNVEGAEIIASASAFTTVATDINEGLAEALEEIDRQSPGITFDERFACSSAAGGLRMMTIGLVPSLTAEAAKRASLGAGAKVTKVYSYELNDDDLEEIASSETDILLLCGGTDGGNSAVVEKNAAALAGLDIHFPIIYAGNRNSASRCKKLLEASGKNISVCPNVMPTFNVLNVEQVQSAIRALFLERIIQARGLSKAQELISGILMPTPASVLAALKLLSEGCQGESGLGELMGVDVGGATTDVYSITAGLPTTTGAVMRSLPEPYCKRTVEGDIGMRYSARGIVEAVGTGAICGWSGLDEGKVGELMALITSRCDTLPDSPELKKLDFALACGAVETAALRHAGTIEATYTPMGAMYLQTGKDLTPVKCIVATGGSLIHADDIQGVMAHAMYSPQHPQSLLPKGAGVLVDSRYMLSGLGLLAEKYPLEALKIMKKELL